MTRFIPRRTLAAAFGVKTATLGFWDRHKRGVLGRGPIYISRTRVVYRVEDVEAFLKSKDLPLSFVTPQERVAARSAATSSPRERAARTQRRPSARSGSTEAPATSTQDEGGREASGLTPEPEVEP